ncbi:MAG: ABA4-like family protein [Hyphomicrobiaceae bacterium]
MPPETLFKICNLLALSGWVALLLSPLIPRLAQTHASLVIPLLLSVAYAGLVMAFWTNADGSFSSLAEVMKLFTKPDVALAGWIHYLAFDLFVGAWEVRTAKSDRVPFALVVPCLALTFMFGPAGFLAIVAIRAARRLATTSAA